MAKMRSNIHVTFEVNAGSIWIMLHEKHRSHREAPSGNTQNKSRGMGKSNFLVCMEGDQTRTVILGSGSARGKLGGYSPPSEEILDSRRRKFGKVTHEKTIFPSF